MTPGAPVHTSARKTRDEKGQCGLPLRIERAAGAPSSAGRASRPVDAPALPVRARELVTVPRDGLMTQRVTTHAYFGDVQLDVVVVAGADVVVIEDAFDVVEIDIVVLAVLAFVVLLEEPPPDGPARTNQ
ncbi:hypothetical protein NUW58_g10792 [Xylaria curta]|uniref:Uncharacterized protein n=1 Tax=Xylaria curta TaxID=42375 RepID=A0ACC1MH09_9PEZI|nr:hypothetical protein NUW58_g10792 [Xylaria curta]